MANLKVPLVPIFNFIIFLTTILFILYNISSYEKYVASQFIKLKRYSLHLYLKIKSYISNSSDYLENASTERMKKCIITGALLSDLGHYEEAIKLYDKALEDAPLFAEAWYDKGHALSELGRFEDALASYDRAIKLNPTFPKALLNKGKLLYRIGKYEDAINCYERAIRINSQHVDVWYNKGLALNKLGRHEEAIASYEEAIRICPLHIDSWVNKGASLGSLGHYEDAIAPFEKAIEICPSSKEAWYGKMLAFQRLHRDAELVGAPAAVNTFAQRISPLCLPSSSKFLVPAKEDVAIYWLNGASKLYKNHLYDESVECYEKAIEVNPMLIEAWCGRGLAFVKLGRYEDAVKSFNKAIDIDPNSLEVWNNKGITLDHLCRFGDAIKCYDMVTDSIPQI